jgi:hypothetical protein
MKSRSPHPSRRNGSAPAEAWGYAIIGMLDRAGPWWPERSRAERDAALLAAQLTELLWEGLAPED